MPVDPNRLNSVGDFVLQDAEEMLALAEPGRLRLFDLVRRAGPVTTGALAEQIGEDTAATDRQLRQLEALGFIEIDGDRWSTPAKGIYFEIPEAGEETQRAARALSGVMLAGAAELPARWVSEAEPELSVEWARAAGLFNARLELTPDEVRDLQEALERLLEPFAKRDRPSAAAPVRMLAFFMPEPPQA
jgi:DNA-binding MarR family transcriptional regulator